MSEYAQKNDTTAPDCEFDVDAEYCRLMNNVHELHNMRAISKTAARKARERIEHWRSANSHRQIWTSL